MRRSTARWLARASAWLAVMLALAPFAAPMAVAAAEANAPVMIGARIVGDASRVRFVADLSRRVDSVVFTLADPYRVIVDLPEVNFALPELAGTTGRGVISAFRYGAISAGKSRRCCKPRDSSASSLISFRYSWRNAGLGWMHTRIV